MANGIPIETMEECDRVCRDGDYEGYADNNFTQAFDILCEKYGGYKNGMKQAIKLMKEQVQ